MSQSLPKIRMKSVYPGRFTSQHFLNVMSIYVFDISYLMITSRASFFSGVSTTSLMFEKFSGCTVLSNSCILMTRSKWNRRYRLTMDFD
eukprot:UN25882